MMKQLLPERIVLELCMIRLTNRDSIVSIEELISKLPEITKGPQEVPNPAPNKIQQTIKEALPPETEKQEKIVSHDKDTSPSVDMTRVKNAWPILVKAMAVKKMSISSYLSEGEPDSVNGDTIIVGFPKEFSFHREVLEEKRNIDSIEAALSQILDVPVKLKFIAVDREIKQPDKDKGASSPFTKEELKREEPIIDTALNIFGGKLLRNRGNT